MDFLVEEFIEGKKRVHKVLTKNFSKIFDNDHGVFSYDDFKKVCKEVIS